MVCTMYQVTPLRREDVLCYKRQAMLAETQIRLRARQKLLEKIQTVMNEIDVSTVLTVRHTIYFIGRV